MSRFLTGKRKKWRTKMVVPVRVRHAGVNRPTVLAHTLDANEYGVKLAGFRGDLNVGDIIEIQHRREWALFRVVWVRRWEESSEKHVGTECIEPDKNIWEIEFSEQPDEYEEKEL